MADNSYTVSHRRARQPLTVEGKDLKSALKSEGLDPAIWKLVKPEKPEEHPPE